MSGTDPQVYATLKNTRRVWAVGAVHGEVAKLRALHAELRGRLEPGDQLVYLGNVLGHGPDPAAAADEIIAYRREFLARPGTFANDHVVLRGSQEEMWRKLNQIQFAPAPAEVLNWMLGHGVDATLAAYGIDVNDGKGCCREGAVAITRWTAGIAAAVRARAGHDDLTAALRRAAFTEAGELLFTAAGLDPERPVSEQGDAFWWGSPDFENIEEPWRGFVRIVRGCDLAGHAPEMGSVTATLDGGAGFGGNLHAACFTLDGKPADWIQI